LKKKTIILWHSKFTKVRFLRRFNFRLPCAQDYRLRAHSDKTWLAYSKQGYKAIIHTWYSGSSRSTDFTGERVGRQVRNDPMTMVGRTEALKRSSKTYSLKSVGHETWAGRWQNVENKVSERRRRTHYEMFSS